MLKFMHYDNDGIKVIGPITILGISEKEFSKEDSGRRNSVRKC